MENNYLAIYENIESFKLKYENNFFEIHLIKKIQNIISIIIKPSKNFSLNLYSTQIIENEIQNKEAKQINLLDYFFQNKAFIISANNSEIKIGIETDEIYTTLFQRVISPLKFIFRRIYYLI